MSSQLAPTDHGSHSDGLDSGPHSAINATVLKSLGGLEVAIEVRGHGDVGRHPVGYRSASCVSFFEDQLLRLRQQR
jgi:hypothetical protein